MRKEGEPGNEATRTFSSLGQLIAAQRAEAVWQSEAVVLAHVSHMLQVHETAGVARLQHATHTLQDVHLHTGKRGGGEEGREGERGKSR